LSGGTASTEGVVESTQVAAKPRHGYGLLLARQTRVQAISAENDGNTSEDFGARETRVKKETVEGR